MSLSVSSSNSNGNRGPLLEGESATFTCAADANPASKLGYAWSVGGRRVEGERGPELTLESVDRRLNGHEVKCEATNAIGRTEAAAVLDVSCEYSYFTHFLLQKESGFILKLF